MEWQLWKPKDVFFEGRGMPVRLMCWRKICNAKHTYTHMHTHTILAKQKSVYQFLKNARNLLQELS